MDNLSLTKEEKIYNEEKTYFSLPVKRRVKVWKYKKPRIPKAILRKNNGAGGINLPHFRLYYKGTGTKTEI